MGDSVLIGKVAIACFGAVAMALAVRWRYLFEIDDRRFGHLLFLAQIVSRIGAFIGFFLVLHLSAQSDVAVYAADGNKVLQGLVPYRDFDTAYGPLFPYLCAGILTVWNSAKALVLTAAALDVLCAWLWWKIAARWFGQRTSRMAAILYAFSPFVFLDVVVAGQNQVWLAVALGLAILLQLRRQDLLSGFVFGFALVGIKFLAVLFVPVLFFTSKNRWRWTAGFIALPAIAYGTVLWISGAKNVLYFTQLAPSSGNLFYVLDALGLPFTAVLTRRISTATVMLALVVLFLSAVIRYRGLQTKQTSAMVVLIMFVMLTLSVKSHATYLALVFFPFCLLVATRITSRSAWIFASFNGLISLEPSLYFRIMDFRPIGAIWRSSLIGMPSWHVRASFLLLELLLLGFYAYYGRVGWRALGSIGHNTPTGEISPRRTGNCERSDAAVSVQ